MPITGAAKSHIASPSPHSQNRQALPTLKQP